jgi:DNA ligase (NAD+)
MSNIVKLLNDKNIDIIEYISNLNINELENVIEYSADKYYNTSISVITDEIYDILIDFLRLKNPKSNVLKKIGSTIKSKNKKELDYWLGSMDKIKPSSNQLEIWLKKYQTEYNLSDKLDGVSALLVYRNNKIINMYTRGTATEGLDITNLIKYLNIPDYETILKYCIKNKINGKHNLISFRGELVIKKDIFKKKWSKQFKNERNIISGLVNSKIINPELASDIDLVLYEIIDPFYSIDKQFKIIKELNFNYVYNKIINIKLTYEYLSNYFKLRRLNSEYLIDGIIVTSIGIYKRNKDGNPEYAFAFKDILEDQKKITKVKSIEWNISKDGFIKPTIIIEPIEIGGVEIKRVTGNNAKFILDKGLGKGAKVEIIRSGDVIPKIENVIKKVKPELPNIDYQWNETNVDIILKDHKDDLNVLIKNIYFFFSKLNTKGLGEKIIEKLVMSGLNSILKIIKATKEDLLKIDNIKEKTAQNIINAIKKSLTNISLENLMSASNKFGHGIGYERIKMILDIYPNLLEDYKKWSNTEFIENIMKIDGWGEELTIQFVNNMEEFIKFYNSIKKYITLETKKITRGYFTNKIVVFSNFRDNELSEQIEKQGGKISSSVSKNTNYLIIKDENVLLKKPTDKINKAIKLNINIITKNKLIKLLN